MNAVGSIPRILLTGGGTGGHVYPAIAIADAVRRAHPLSVVAFAGTQDRLEWDAVPRAGYEIHPIRARGIVRRWSWRNVLLPFTLLRGWWQSRRLIRDFDPDVVVATGGYVSGPVLLAARSENRPILVQEQNAYPGLTNRIGARWADRVHVAFEAAREHFDADRITVSGNPIRPDLVHVDRADARRRLGLPERARVVLVFGGSGGSRALNEAVLDWADHLLEAEDRYVLWQTGKKYFDEMKERAPVHERLLLTAYLQEMKYAYGAADLAVCRAGAITCSELTATGTPSVLVPSPNVAADHQTVNARSLADREAAILLEEDRLEVEGAELISYLLGDETRRNRMAQNARAMARFDAADRIAEDVLDLAGVPAGDRETGAENSTRSTLHSEPTRS
jgi:UDP-N-acetylglucosamine--N-acetylmuramyl-(pentapeptide) pyrophosphoryl-undecaprenol N-acetylglucosamine transferase